MPVQLRCFICLMIPALCFGQNAGIDSLLEILKTSGEDTPKVILLNSLCRQFWELSDYSRSEKYAKEALALSEKLKYAKGVADAHNNIGLNRWTQGDYPIALSEYRIAQKIRKEAGDREGLASSHNNIGNIYAEQGNYPEALKEYFAALSIREKTGNKGAIAGSHNNIGIIYEKLGNYAEALKEYHSALEIVTVLGNKHRIAQVHNNMGNVYALQGNYRKALDEQTLAYEIRRDILDKQGMMVSLNNIGHLYECLGDYPRALEQNMAALKIAKEIGEPQGVIISYIILASVRLKMKHTVPAKMLYSDAMDLAMKMGSKDNIKDCYLGLAQVDSAMGNYKSGLNNYKMYILYRDSLVNDANTKKTVQMQMQYEFGRQQAADSIRNAEGMAQEQLKHDQEIRQQRTYTYGGVIGFLLMLLIAGVSYRAYSQKKKANEIISHQKHLVEEKQREILDSIHYARRIQQSLLPTEIYMAKYLDSL